MSYDGVDVKFAGIVQSYDEAKKFGMVSCDEAQRMWGQQIYVYKDVLAAAAAGVGDSVRFGIHLNPRGQPQVSLPCWKLDETGTPIGVPEGTQFFNCEELASENSDILDQLKQEIEDMSNRQNKKRGSKGDPGKGKEKGTRQRTGPSPAEAWGAASPRSSAPARGGSGRGDAGWGAGGGAWRDEEFSWGKGSDKGKGKGKGWAPPPHEVTLFVSGVPPGASRRELLHIFRQYAGFTGLRLVERQDHNIVFITFETIEQADFVTSALNGYVFDEEAPPEEQTQLSLAVSLPKEKGKEKGKGKGKAKGK